MQDKKKIKKEKINGINYQLSVFLGVFFLLFLFDLAVLVNVSGFLFGNFSFVDLVLGFESILGGLIYIPPHIRNDFGQFGDFGIWIVSLYFAVNFFSVEEKC
jgi:hypothetical protein